MQLSSPPQESSNKIKLTIKNFPHQTSQEGFLNYNLYYQDQLNGVQSCIPLINPCVRQGCGSTCYFDSRQLNHERLRVGCQICGNSNQKIYLDNGLKQFMRQQYEYIIQNRPLSVDINPKTMQFYFSSRAIKNNFIGKVSDFIGNAIVKQKAFDQIFNVRKKTLEFSNLRNKINQIFVPKPSKKDYLIYSFCKYHPQPYQSKEINYLLLFLNIRQSPLKVSLHCSQSIRLFSSTTYLRDCKIGYLSEESTFIFYIPTKEGTKYYVSRVDFHLNFEQQSLEIIEMPQWQEQIGRFNGSLIVDQLSNSFYIVGGYDFEKEELPPCVVAFEQCLWYIPDKQYRFVAERNIKQQKQYINTQHIGIMYSSFMLYNPRNVEIFLQFQQDEKYLLGLGGSCKDFSIFATGTDKSYQNNIRYLRLPNSQNKHSVIYQKSDLKYTFPLKNYIMLQCPYFTDIKFEQKYRSHAIVFGGYKQNQGKVYQVSQDIYLLDTKHLNQTRLLQQKFHYGHLLSHNIDNFSTLLYDQKTNSFYLRATYPVKQPIKSKNRMYLHYLIVEFNLKTEEFKVFPGLIEQF